MVNVSLRKAWMLSLSLSSKKKKKKKMEVVEVRDFCPISLIGGIYKIIAKVLAIHLPVVLDDIISASQNDFVLELQILDFVLITNEYLDCRLKSEV